MNLHLVACIFLILVFFTLGLLMVNNTAVLDSYLGYRTRMARRNQDTWDEANSYAGKCMMFSGILMIFVILLIEFIFENVDIMFKTLGTIILISIVYIFFITERRLKKVFFRDGKRKPNR